MKAEAEKATTRCTLCHAILPTASFFVSRVRENGLQPACAKCQFQWFMRNRLVADAGELAGLL